jgi:hypothetical protein
MVISRSPRKRWVPPVAALILVVTIAVALWWSHRHPDDAKFLASLIPVSSIFMVYLAWRTFREDHFGPLDHDHLANVADNLAKEAQALWSAEAADRHLNDPWPLPVEFAATQRSATLAADWSSITRLRRTGAGKNPGQGVDQLRSIEEVAGHQSDIASRFSMLPLKRMLILGAPGSGKSMLVLQLLLDLLAARGTGDPVPILLQLNTFNPRLQSFKGWVIDELLEQFEGLQRPVGRPTGASWLGQALVDGKYIWPIVDGLDEMETGLQALALSKINAELSADDNFVLTSRFDEYEQLVTKDDGLALWLTAAAAIEMLPLKQSDAIMYLEASSGQFFKEEESWTSIAAAIKSSPEGPTAQALSTPLMVTLARRIYCPPLTPSPTASSPDPIEMLDHTRFPTRESLEAHLLDGLIPAVYPVAREVARGLGKARWTVDEAQRYHEKLSQELTRRGRTSFRWWDLSSFVSPTRWICTTVVAGSLAGAFIGLVSYQPQLVLRFQKELSLGISGRFGFVLAGLIQGAFYGCALGYLSQSLDLPPAEVHLRRPRRGEVGIAIAAGLSLGASQALSIQIDLKVRGEPFLWLYVGLAWGLLVAVIILFGMSLGLFRSRSDPIATNPARSIKNDRVATVAAIIVASALGLSFSLIYLNVKYGIPFALGAPLAVAIFSPSSRLLFWACGNPGPDRVLPLRAIAFLEDAHQRGVLRVSGVSYEYRHKELQQRLCGGPDRLSNRAGSVV